MEEKDIELIDRYLNAALTEAETGEFRRRLAADKDFAQLYEDMAHIEKGLQEQALHEAWQTILATEAAMAEDPGRSAGSGPRWKVWVPVAASLALLVVAAWWLMNQSSGPEELFAQYFEVYPNVEAPIYRDSSAADSLSAKDLAFRRYAEDDFAGAIEIFESIGEPDEGTLFYLGMSYLAKGEAAKAAQIWEPLTREAQDYRTQVQWYLALAWLKLEELEKSKALLEELARSGTAYEERSKAVLKGI